MTNRKTRFSEIVSLRLPHDLVKDIKNEIVERQKLRMSRVTFSEVIVDILKKYFIAKV